MRRSFDEFAEIVVCDSEYSVRPGEVPDPLCIAFMELRSGRRGVVFAEEMRRAGRAPFDCGPDTLVVAHYATAEVATLLALGFPVPHNVVDTFAEFRVLTNGDAKQPASLLACARFFGISAMPETKKDAMRALALRDGLTHQELCELGAYCIEDVEVTVAVFRALQARGIDLPRALVRGQFMTALGRTERLGIPVDRTAAATIAERKDEVALDVVKELDLAGLFDGVHLRQSAIREFVAAHRTRWPRTQSGRFATARDVVARVAEREPALASTVEVLDLLSALRQVDLPVGRDGRARAGLRPFATKTGRGAPAAREFLLAQAGWRRGLVRPVPGTTLAYLDYATEEFAIAAALSGDEAMWADYMAGDPYIALAIRLGHAPAGATDKTHADIRARFKALVLGLQFSMSAYGLAKRLAVGLGAAEQYLLLHRRAYSTYWRWNDGVVFRAPQEVLVTPYGWCFHPASTTKPRTLRNWPIQSAGGDILRLACIFGWERGVKICAPLHDAMLIEAQTDEIENAVATMKAAMVAASVCVVGRPIRVSHQLIKAGAPWVSPRGRPTWDRVTSRLGPVEAP